jgi:hypothetical protein
MGVLLDRLRDLQEIELQIFDIRRQLAGKQRQVERQAARLQQTQSEIAAAREELRRSQMEVDDADLDLKARSAQVNKIRETLNTIRTNKEYAAILSQLNNEKAEVNRIETRALELMGKQDDRKKAFGEREAAAAVEEQKLQDVRKQFEQTSKMFADRMAALMRERDTAAGQLDAKFVDLFTRVSERYEGEAMAKVVRTHPRRSEFVCEGCNMSITMELANILLTRDEVNTCDTCGRILYMEPGT